MNYRQYVLAHQLAPLFTQATIGLEKEGQRVDAQAYIKQTEHPQVFGKRSIHPYIQTDFAESQLELITPPTTSEQEMMRYLSAIHEVVLRGLPADEYIWPFSMPASFPDEAMVQVAQLESEKERNYRQYLAEKYGKYKQLISGIHYNFGFTSTFIEQLAQVMQQDSCTLRNDLYMQVARQFIRYQWLLVYLFGATPFVDDTYFKQTDKPTFPVRSLRASDYGYVNSKDIQASYQSIQAYAHDLQQLVKTGKLIAEKEFYASVRFRGGRTIQEVVDNGIQYLEFRLFDINPFEAFGIASKDARFIHLFIMLMLWLDEADATQSVRLGKQYSEQVALAHPFDTVPFLEEGNWLFDQLVAMAEQCQLPAADLTLIAEKRALLLQPQATLAAQVWQGYEQYHGDFAQFGMVLAKQYKQRAMETPYTLSAFAKMELSTQALIADAIRLGVQVQVLDEHDQFLRLHYQGQDEYVKNGNMTSKDAYISPLIMENKVVTKKVLADQGFKVPESIQCQSLDEARGYFPLVANKPIVIKPKSTNFGLGISIFKEGTNNQDDFLQAIEIALAEDSEVMIEAFIKGTEYRFFVLDGQTRAVLLRVPAHVIGDGRHTIAELVALKNDNKLRGDGVRTPLKKIVIGKIEQLQLKEQGFSPDTILSEQQVAYLRENSNISTGGDSIDVTDLVHDSYKDIAVGITQAMFARVCGVDLIIEDIAQPASDDNYGIVEANFNPMMMMHIFPAQGQSRRVSVDVLCMLFPSLDRGGA